MDGPEIDAEFDVGSAGARAMAWLTRWFRRNHETSRLAREAKEVLGVDDDRRPAFCHVSVHSQATRTEPHPDNQDALGVLARRAIPITTVDGLRASVGKNLVMIGSPTAERLSRLAFGYTPTSADNGLALTNPPLELPFAWRLDPHEFGDAKAKRLVRGTGWSSRPNWSIVNQVSGKVFIPSTDSSEVLTSDYLLITRMPNFLSTKALGEDHYLVSVGGAHGTGTRAIELLLKDRTVLAELAEALKQVDTKGFQALFEVGHLEHDERRSETRARAISLADFEALDGDHRTWQDAAEAVADSVVDLQTSTDPSE